MAESEWLDVAADQDSPHAQLHMWRYEWAANRVKGERVANAACGSNYGAFFFQDKAITGFDRSFGALECAKRDGFVPVVRCDITEQRFENFDALVTIETLEHLPDPWLWLAQIWGGVHELVASVPIVPTKHMNPYHLHDFTSAEFVMELVRLGWYIRDMKQQCDDVLLIYATR